MRKGSIRRLCAAGVIAAAALVPLAATPAQAYCYYEVVEGSDPCGDCMNDKIEAYLNKLGIEVYCLA